MKIKKGFIPVQLKLNNFCSTISANKETWFNGRYTLFEVSMNKEQYEQIRSERYKVQPIALICSEDLVHEGLGRITTLRIGKKRIFVSIQLAHKGVELPSYWY